VTWRGTRSLRIGQRAAFACGSVVAVVLTCTLAAFAAPVSPASPLPGWQRLTDAGDGVVTLVGANDGTIAALAAPVPGSPLRTGVRRSIDGGRTWQVIDRGLPLDLSLVAGAFATGDSRSLVVAGVGALYRLASGSTSWERLRVPLPPVTAILFDQSDPRHMVVGTEIRGNFASDDGGETWFEASTGLPRDRYGITGGAISFAQCPADPSVVLMATSFAPGLYRSANAGRSWRPVPSGLPAGGLNGIWFHPEIEGLAVAVAEKGVAVSRDRGQTWERITSVPDGISQVGFVAEPGTPDAWYLVGARGNALRTTNRGVSWVELPVLPRPVSGVIAVPATAATRAPTSPASPRLEGVPSLLASAAGGVWALALPPTAPASPAIGPDAGRFVQATEHNLSPRFAAAYDRLGAFERFGYPRTELFLEGGLMVQWFQRGRLEFRPDLEGTAYEVQISLLGDQLLTDRPPPGEPIESSSDRRYFPETGFVVQNAFLRYFDARGGIDALGYPITPEVNEADRPVQYFQRARLEYRKDFAGTTREVQLGLIGDELLRQRGWLE
jgi:photosystem II stability/assembly factor-like uncharacterized protein